MPGPVKTVTLRLQADSAEAQRRLDAIFLEAERLKTLNPTLTPKIDKAAVTAGLAVLRADLKATGRESDDLSGRLGKLGTAGAGAGGGLGSMLTPMGGLIGAGAALAPIAVTLGAGLGGLGIAAAGTLGPLLKASKGVGGLSANIGKLNPEQQAAARSLLSLEDSYKGFERALSPVILQDFGIAMGVAKTGLHDLLPVSQATGKALGGMLSAIDRELQSAQFRDFFAWMAKQAGPDIGLLTANVVDLTGAVPPLMHVLQPFGTTLLTLTDDTAKVIGPFARAALAIRDWEHRADSAVERVPVLGAGVKGVMHLLGGLGHALGFGSTAIQHAGAVAVTSAGQMAQLAAQVGAVSAAESKSLNTALAYSGSLITSKTDAISFAAAMKLSHDRIGTNTQAQRDSFSAANTYIAALDSQAHAALASGHGVDAASAAIRAGLPALEAAKTKSTAYWQSLRVLEGYAAKLKSEHVSISISAAGHWSVVGGSSLPGHHAAGIMAAGGKVTGGIPGRDSVPIWAMPGELVVPVSLAPAVAPFLKAQGVPGMAAGGVVGSYHDGLPGLGKWLASENTATISAVAAAMATAFSSAMSGTGSGALGGDAAASAALARRMMPAWGSGAQWAAWNALNMAESGWDRFARNVSSGAYGIPQALPPTKLPFAGQAAGGSSAAAQIGWQIGYIGGRYGSPAAAERHELAAHWYDAGGLMPPGVSIAVNSTGRPERVGGGDVHYHINVHAMQVSSPRQIGAQIVSYIRQFESGSGSGWRKS
jgi:hypothetical protein